MAVVTLSRQYGAGGLRVASAIADALGLKVADREVVEEAAHRLGMDQEVARSRDERSPGVLEEVGLALAAAGIEYGQFPPTPLDDRDLAQAVRRVIEGLATAGGYVILGRGSQAALGGRADACHLSLVADLRDRVRRISEWQRLSERDAEEHCRRVDAEREAYVRRFYAADIRDAILYDATLNTSTLGIDGAVTVALAAIERRLGLRPAPGA